MCMLWSTPWDIIVSQAVTQPQSGGTVWSHEPGFHDTVCAMSIMQLQVACGCGAKHGACLPSSLSRTEVHYLLTCSEYLLSSASWLGVFDVHKTHAPLLYSYHLVLHRRSKGANRNNIESFFWTVTDASSCEQLAAPNTVGFQCQTGYTQTHLCSTETHQMRIS